MGDAVGDSTDRQSAVLGVKGTGFGEVGPGQVGLEQVGLGHLIGGSEIGAIASAGATNFVASFFRCLANRMHGGRTM